MGELIRKSRVARSTGVRVELEDAEHPDSSIDPTEGRWVAICRDHGESTHLGVYREARKLLAHPEDWCGSCGSVEAKGDPNGGFSEEERKRGLARRRAKADAARKTKEEEESRRAAARDLEEQWTVWIAGCPVLEPLFSEDEAEEASALRSARSVANQLAKEAKKTRGSLERKLSDLPERPTKKAEKEKRAELETWIAEADAEEVSKLDEARIADEALSRLSRIGYLRHCLDRHWRLTRPGKYGRYLARTGEVDLRIPDNYLDSAGYAEVAKEA